MLTLLHLYSIFRLGILSFMFLCISLTNNGGQDKLFLMGVKLVVRCQSHRNGQPHIKMFSYCSKGIPHPNERLTKYGVVFILSWWQIWFYEKLSVENHFKSDRVLKSAEETMHFPMFVFIIIETIQTAFTKIYEINDKSIDPLKHPFFSFNWILRPVLTS